MHRSHVLAASILLALHNANALSSGPASCNSPIAVDGPHTANNQDGNGAISEGGFSVKLGDTELKADGVNTFPAGEHTITLKATDTDFRGFLFRLASDSVGDTTGLLASDSADAQVLDLCTNMNIGSLAHNNPELKDEIAGTINWSLATSDIELEVTVVVSNQATDPPGSVWYTTKFQLETTTEAPGDTPTKAPANPPSMMPSQNGDSGVAVMGTVAAFIMTVLSVAVAAS